MFKPGFHFTTAIVLSGIAFSSNADATWQGNATLSFSRSTGNTVSTSYSIALDEARKTDIGKTSIYVSSLYGKSNGTKNADKWLLGIRQDHYLNEELFGFGLLELEHDGLANLDRRTGTGLGLGYHWLQSEANNFDLFGGLSYSRSNSLDGVTTSGNELLLGEESSHKLSDTMQFKQKLSYYPSLKYSGQYRSQSQLDINSSMALSISLQNKHATDVAAGVKHSDTVLLTGLKIKL